MNKKVSLKRGPEMCIRCAFCNAGDDAYRLSLDERRAPRHIVVSCAKSREGAVLYASMLNGRSEELCPLNIGIDAAVIAARRKMVRTGQETVANKEFITKLREGKNPYR